MSPRTGRPKAENPKDVDVKVRLDKATDEELVAYCKKHSLTKAAAIRKGIELLLANNTK